MKKGKFIVIEGGEGSGKSSQIKVLKEKFGDRIVFTREPGGTFFAEKIRELILCNESEKVGPEAIFALFWASRADHMKEIIIPAIKSGKTVISDRFDSSTFAYQVFGEESYHLEELFWVTRKVFLLGFEPDIYIYLNVDPDIGLNRKMNNQPEEINHLEKREVYFHERVREGFNNFLNREDINSEIIDANNDFDIVQNDLCKIINKMLD